MPRFLANEVITVAGTAIGATAATITAAATGQYNYAVFGPLETAQVRYKFYDAPTASVGKLLEIGDVLICKGDEVSQVKFIRTGATSGSLPAEYGIA